MADPPADRARLVDVPVWNLIERGFDPEAYYLWATYWARLGDPAQAISYLSRAVDGGYFCYPALVEDPWLDPLRTDPVFVTLLASAETRHTEAAATFAKAGGTTLLGLS